MKYILVGKIVGTHGIKGEVKVLSETSFKEERYKKGNILYLAYDNQMIEIKINSYRRHKNIDLITFNDLTNINDVLKYVNCDIYVNKDDLQELDDDEYYYEDLIGLKVTDDHEEEIGEVVDINEVPQGQILVVRKKDGNEVLIPFVEEFIKEVDLDKEVIIITPIEGLL